MVIAQREFDVDGQILTCRFYQPEADGVDFRCNYELDWPEGRRMWRAYGGDAVQAIILAMSSAHADLLAVREKEGRKVTWLNSQSLGLPVSSMNWAPATLP